MTVYNDAHRWYTANWDPDMPVGEWWKLLADSGWGFPWWPSNRFGQGLTHRDAHIADQARDDVGAFGPSNGIGVTLVAPTMFEHGPDDLLDRYLTDIAYGRTMWCQLFSEPGAGSDLAAVGTAAQQDGDQWIVNGQKVWTSGGHLADWAVLMARTDAEVSKHAGISFFIIDMAQAGVDIRPLRDMTGDSEFNEVFLTDAVVQKADLIGDLNDGWRVAMTMLQVERDLDAVGHDGGGDVINAVDLDASVGQVQQEQLHGTAASGFSYATGSRKDEVTHALIDAMGPADALLRQAKAQAVIERRVLDWNGVRQVSASAVKFQNAELCRRLRDLGFAGGGMATQLGRDDQPDGGHFLKSALFTQGMAIAGGTDEVQRNIVGERVLGLPKEPKPLSNPDR
ncbi:MAG: alkylation response protein AidB-like acyl-CoA dehydrogenase [Acidimicrobiales bacterium]|jgi:alkylation response protein AidB-like acyl-CoA dehydrogenase